MKYPALLPFDQILPQLDDFDTIIDVRSPGEFADDHIPGAINCPVLDDAQRVLIGTLYKQVSAFDAKKAGAALVAKNIGHHIETRFNDKTRDWKPLVYCWRGGNRSGSMAHILAKIGWPVVQLDGGYKEFRRHVSQSLENISPDLQFRVICGTTGSGKSRLLQTLVTQGAQVLDLEQLASHRGSVLGHLPDEPQPTQKHFESSIWQALRSFDPARVIYVESESKKVGNLRVPEALMAAMRTSPCIALHLAHSARIDLLMEDYVHFVKDATHLNRQLDCLLQVHGKEKISHWQALASGGQMPLLVDELLVQHYDPAYLKSIARNFLQFAQAQPLELGGISAAAFDAAARELLDDET